MTTINLRASAKDDAIHRAERKIELPRDAKGRMLTASDYFGENVFDLSKSESIPEKVKKELAETSKSGKKIKREHMDIVASAVTEWAIAKGATHFCHWFQPLTGNTAEKHDSFLQIKDHKAIDKLSVSQLLQGEPDASSFPHGGSRSTFEARGYTSWDLSSPMFLVEGPNGKTLYIPTAFVSYNGEALDVKTPLLRSINKLGQEATRFFHLIGQSEVKSVQITCGCEQEYFLIDKAFYFARPDLVMTGRTLIGGLTSRNQQLSDHYFGDISDRVLAFMQEFDYELHRMGIPAKTRHNEVAPGQFEIAPIFSDANVAADNNQMLMALIRKVAAKHNFAAILHEKPFTGINGSGKHLNWSMATDTGQNLLEPGENPHQNIKFLAVLSMVVEAVFRHGDALRMGVASQANDHRLGAHEAPPSIMSVFLGDTLNKICEAIKNGKTYEPAEQRILDIGADQLAHLAKDNTDRNRTSPFAFTGNKFEFRAVGASQAVGFPMSILNAAVAEVFHESNNFIEKAIKDGRQVDDALLELSKQWLGHAWAVVFNGDGYSEEWVKEAKKRGLPNNRTTPEALKMLSNPKACEFLTRMGVFNQSELNARYNILLERYIMLREIEFDTLCRLINQSVIPAALDYKAKLLNIMKDQKDSGGAKSSVESEIYQKVSNTLELIYFSANTLRTSIDELKGDDQQKAETIAQKLLPLSVEISKHANELEDLVPNDLWNLPNFYDMLFLR